MIEKRRSSIQGWGVFATRPITKNTRIVDYAGEKITNRESLKREVRYLKSGHIWCFKLNRLYARDAAVDGNVARFINHSCRPNCYAQVVGETIWIRAAKNIRRGRRADLRLLHRRRRLHPVPVPSGLQGHALMHVLYLHGFASSAQSSKAAFFRVEARGARRRGADARLQPARLLDADRQPHARAGTRRDRHGRPVRWRSSDRASAGSWPSTPRSRRPGASIAWSCWRRRSTSAATACAISATAASTSGAARIGWRCSTTASGG